MRTTEETMQLLQGPLADAPLQTKLGVINILPPEIAHPILIKMVQDGSWNQVNLQWFSTAYLTSRSAENPMAAEAELYREVLRAMALQPLTPDFSAVFSHLRNAWSRMERALGDAFPWHDVEQWVDWLRSQVGPGDAGTVAEVATAMVQRSDKVESRWTTTMLPLAEWLLTHGAAELRRGERAETCWLLARIMFYNGRNDLVPLALRYLLNNASGVKCLNQYHYPFAWRICEVALEQKHTSPGLAVDFALARLRAGQEPYASVWQPLGSATEYPRVHAVLFNALLKGEFDGTLDGRRLPPPQDNHVMHFNPPHHFNAAWQVLIAAAPPSSLHFRSPRTAGLALGVFSSLENDLGGDAERQFPHCHSWLALVVREIIRLYRVLDEGLPLPVSSTLSMLSGHRDTQKGLSLGLVQALKEHERLPALAHAFALLDFWPEPDWLQTGSILLALPRTASTVVTNEKGTFWKAHMPRVRDALRQLLNRTWDQSLGGVDLEELARGVHDVEFAEPLQNDDKVECRNGVLWVDPEYVRDQCNIQVLTDDAMARCLLYVVHEWIHIAQAIGKKSTIGSLRATGAEATLMHFDLGADHAAALIVAELRPDWELVWLKDVQGRSLADFPATSQHTAAARSRKANRLVGLRLDFLARQDHRSMDGINSGYVFAEYSPGSGAFLVLISGPPMKVLLLGSATPRQVAVLDKAADASERPIEELNKLDAVLRTLLAARS